MTIEKKETGRVRLGRGEGGARRRASGAAPRRFPLSPPVSQSRVRLSRRACFQFQSEYTCIIYFISDDYEQTEANGRVVDLDPSLLRMLHHDEEKAQADGGGQYVKIHDNSSGTDYYIPHDSVAHLFFEDNVENIKTCESFSLRFSIIARRLMVLLEMKQKKEEIGGSPMQRGFRLFAKKVQKAKEAAEEAAAAEESDDDSVMSDMSAVTTPESQVWYDEQTRRGVTLFGQAPDRLQGVSGSQHRSWKRKYFHPPTEAQRADARLARESAEEQRLTSDEMRGVFHQLPQR